MNPHPDPRYSRQMLLPGFGENGQRRLRQARVLLIGLGGLGSPIAMYLAAAGVGELRLADFDAVDLSNLHRQIVHDSTTVGRPKVDSAMTRLAALNPEVALVPLKGSATAARLPELIADVDLVIDACDNFATRFAINAACMSAGIPLVSGAAIGTEGQVSAFSARPGGPCYQCLYPREVGEEEGCAVRGVLGPVVGIIGATQATEAIKILTGIGEPLFGRLLLLDALRMQWRSLTLPPDPDCPVCGGHG
ncbi:molybdopterin-synthase adenylyltransferase MoeB [Marichromatium gracile]|uniref:HesA/MoeB/ThiF family protein n=1 Tax=Marichromatium gracile TaxID=1048 RepID=UPI001F3D6328|nr:molybdopterin-synthase adenylyltransferase MoeB [Marichromatium gracile]MCF1184110.1 molybdopterin-synthase adenylyltransferase MoeB [Marichromatium gracile]